ncbi:MAG: hypothetical protein HC889_02250 [Synechococcaceae cyanobacterium SM1_2_3]|nr:hypothetical protein [Synechococcaceae cyanobacterium SM1_2_3]
MPNLVIGGIVVVGLGYWLYRQSPPNPKKANDLKIEAHNLNIQGQYEKALVKIQKAAKIFHNLIKSGQRQYLPDLAETWRIKGDAHGGLLCSREALSCFDEAANIYQTLINNQVQYLPELADTWHSKALYFTDEGCLTDALSSIEESAKIYQALIDSGNREYLPDLAETWRMKCLILTSSYRFDDALKYFEKAAKISVTSALLTRRNTAPN